MPKCLWSKSKWIISLLLSLLLFLYLNSVKVLIKGKAWLSYHKPALFKPNLQNEWNPLRDKNTYISDQLGSNNSLSACWSPCFYFCFKNLKRVYLPLFSWNWVPNYRQDWPLKAVLILGTVSSDLKRRL